MEKEQKIMYRYTYSKERGIKKDAFIVTKTSNENLEVCYTPSQKYSSLPFLSVGIKEVTEKSLNTIIKVNKYSPNRYTLYTTFRDFDEKYVKLLIIALNEKVTSLQKETEKTLKEIEKLSINPVKPKINKV